MATKRYYLNKGNHAAEEIRPDPFGLIGGADAAAAFLHGFEITMDGCVVIPELRPKLITCVASEVTG